MRFPVPTLKGMFARDKCMAYVVICVLLALMLNSYTMNCMMPGSDLKCAGDSAKGLSEASMAFFTLAVVLSFCLLKK